MIDGVVKTAIEEALRFLQPGDLYRCEVNGHTMLVIALRGGLKCGGYFVACESCEWLLQTSVTNPRPAFLAIHHHTKNEESPKELTDAHVHPRED